MLKWKREAPSIRTAEFAVVVLLRTTYFELPSSSSFVGTDLVDQSSSAVAASASDNPSSAARDLAQTARTFADRMATSVVGIEAGMSVAGRERKWLVG